jgi:hypothetical protein
MSWIIARNSVFIIEIIVMKYILVYNKYSVNCYVAVIKNAKGKSTKWIYTKGVNKNEI